MANDIITHARRAARVGPVFPVQPDASKKPLHKGWQQGATFEPLKDWRLFTQEPCNIGIFTGHPDRPLLAVDVDNKNGKCGDETLARLELEGKDFPPTYEQRTPTGGRHLVYSVDAPVKQGANVLGPGLDIRSRGGYIVGSGSVIDGKAYTDNGAEVAPAPAWLVEACGRVDDNAPTANAAPVDIAPERAEAAERRARNYLATEAPKGEEGSRNETAYRVAARVRDFGCDQPAAFALMREHWQCAPPLEDDELAHVCNSAYTYAKDTPGNADPAQQFLPVKEAPDPEPAPGWVQELNREYFVLNEGGRTIIGRWTRDRVLERSVLERSTFEDFRRLHMNRHIGVTTDRRGDPVKVRLADAWLEHPQRREYRGGVAFAPGAALPDDTLNLWQGFAIKPKPGDWSKLRAHIRDVICSGDETADRYVIGWLARLVQQPGEQGQVALVTRGGRGVGKGTLGNFLLRILGQHGLYIANARHLTGNFNAHLRDAVMVFADEAFYAGDRQHTGVLKALVTEPYLTIEAKHQNPATARNVVHLLMASNDDWVVPAGVDERRFCVLDVSDRHQQDRQYFGAIRSEADAGGLAAMLHDLLAYDLSGFDVFDVPQTKALADQKVHSLRGPLAWLSTVLQSGRIGAWVWERDGLTVPKADAYHDYKTHCQERPTERYNVADERLWARTILGAMADAIAARRPGTDKGEPRPRCWVFAPIEECRRAFARHLRVPALEWDPIESDEPIMKAANDAFR